MNRDIDPLPVKTARLAAALTENRIRVQSQDGTVVVEATARGAVRVQLSDDACRWGGAELSRIINQLSERAVTAAQQDVGRALADFRADRRVSDAVARTMDEMQRSEAAPGSAAIPPTRPQADDPTTAGRPVEAHQPAPSRGPGAQPFAILESGAGRYSLS